MLPQVIHEWEKVAAAAVREGGEDDGLKTQMLRLAQAGSPSPAPAPECRSSHSHLGPRRTSTLARALTRLPYGLTMLLRPCRWGAGGGAEAPRAAACLPG